MSAKRSPITSRIGLQAGSSGPITCDNPSLKELLAKNPPVMREQQTSVVAWRSAPIYECAA
jgi:hypothetical protein